MRYLIAMVACVTVLTGQANALDLQAYESASEHQQQTYVMGVVDAFFLLSRTIESSRREILNNVKKCAAESYHMIWSATNDALRHEELAQTLRQMARSGRKDSTDVPSFVAIAIGTKCK